MPEYDLVFRGGTILDGSGQARFRADLAVTGDRIEAIAHPLPGRGREEIDASGLMIAPGFIDVHTHDDALLLHSPDMAPKIHQGVTSVIVGNCGISLAPLTLSAPPVPPLDLLGDASGFRFPRFADYAEALRDQPPAVNALALIGHMTLRAGVMDRLDQAATPAEVGEMQTRLRQSLAAGAGGLSSGLAYPPSREAPMGELVALAQVLRFFGGIYTTHLRQEADQVIAALAEAIGTAGVAQVPLVISHHKCLGALAWGKSIETLAMIEEANRRQSVALDAYPYCASSTILHPDFVDRAERVTLTWSAQDPAVAGADLDVLAKGWGISRRSAAERLVPGGAIYFSMQESDVQRILAYPRTMIGSDGLPHDRRPHPRLWGTFPRVLGHYARDIGLFPLETAVHKMTGLSAAEFGLTDRGLLIPGFFADLTLFNPDRVLDRATYAEPTRPPVGIEHVLVNGRFALRDGQPTGTRNGRLLHRPSPL
jgi:N-acyl-D-amino-acid deacylase